jgi:phosphoserine aminotransferase
LKTTEELPLQKQRNEAKAKLLYDEIDSNPLFETFCVKEDRSLMNVSFKITDESKKKNLIMHGKQQESAD